MILLFNKVYLKVDHLIKTERNRIVISQQFGMTSTVFGQFAHTIEDSVPHEPLYRASTLEELFEKDFASDPNQFFQMLLKHPASDRLTIYCDPDAMFALLTKFWKTLLPGMTSEAFYTLINFAFSQFVEVLGVGHASYTSIPTTQAETIRNTYASYLLDDNKPMVLKHWQDMQPFMITRAHREIITKGCAIEFQLATLLLNPNWRLAQSVKNKIVRLFMKQAMQEYVLDVKYNMLVGLLNFKHFEPNTNFNFFEHTLDQLVQMHPQYAFLADPLFLPDNIGYILSNYDMTSLQEVRAKLFAEPGADYGFDWSELLRNDLSFDDIIAYEVASPVVKLFMSRGDYLERVNPYMIDHIFDLYRKNQLDALTPYKLT